MSWEPLVPRQSHAKRNVPQHPITVTCTKGGRYARRVFITVRPDLLEDPPEFWKLGQAVTASVGKGSHAGQMRIASGGQIKIKSSGGSGKTIAACGLRITIPDWPEITPGGHPATPVTDEDYGADWLEFRLPEWAAAAVVEETESPRIAAVPDKESKSGQQAKPAPQHHGKKAA